MKAPWPDYKGNEIHEGDKIRHPSGKTGIVVLHSDRKENSDKWTVDYGTGRESRLCLQIGDKGQAVVVDYNSNTQKTEQSDSNR